MFRKWDEDLVGVLADDQYVYEKTGKHMAVFVNSQNVVQFGLRLASQAPDGFPNVKLFTGYSTDLERYGYVEDYTANLAERSQRVREFLEHYLVIFRAYPRGEYYNIKDVRLVPIPLAHQSESVYIPVPVFSQASHTHRFDDFMYKLRNNHFVGQIQHISSRFNDTPPFILWNEGSKEEPQYRVIGTFARHRYGYGGFQFIVEELKIADFQDEWENCMLADPGDPTILFVDQVAHAQILETLESVSPYQPQVIQLQTPAKTEVAAALPTSAVVDEGQLTSDTAPNAEGEFLQVLMQTAREQGLLYDEADLINFHTAMKTSNLVILAGMSGTGKSKLVHVYGHALGMDDEQLNVIPVRPAWTDDADLIGYVDTMNMVYRPGDSGLVNTLVQAAENPERLYLVCFDEMNLARVEHYFSQFLSVLEMEPSRRRLRLYNDELMPKLYNSNQYPPSVLIGDNVLFVGTVNLDESTYHFSDKVLDRANVISLRVLPFACLRNVSDERKRTKASEEMSLTAYRAFTADNNQFQLTERETEFLERIHELMQTASTNLGVGFRVVRQINGYLMNLPKTQVLTRRQAFDRQIVQRILTKLRGPEDQLRQLLGSYKPDRDLIQESRLLALTADYSDISDFEASKRVLHQKAKELKLYGYTF